MDHFGHPGRRPTRVDKIRRPTAALSKVSFDRTAETVALSAQDLTDSHFLRHISGVLSTINTIGRGVPGRHEKYTMPTSAFFAVLRDTAKLAAAAADDLASQTAKVAATAVDDLASQAAKMSAAADDIATLTGKATAKTAGIAGDDLAVGAGQVGGISPNREIPAVLRIMRGSALNKAWLSVVLLIVAAFAPVLITVALVLGALYLAFEGGEALLERFHPHSLDDEFAPMSEDQKVRGAIRTDLILSLEILVISLSATGDVSLMVKAGVLLLVSVVMTLLVYGIILLIIRLDDMGLAMARRGSPRAAWIGNKMANAAPLILKALDPIGMVAMFAVAGGIFSHLLHIEYPHWAVGLLGDGAMGAIIGVLLAGGFTVAHHFWAKRHTHKSPSF